MAKPSDGEAMAKPSATIVNFALFGAVGAWSFLGWGFRHALKQGFATELGVIGPGNVLHGDVIANMLGAFIFGLMFSMEKHVKPYHPTTYVGVTTGFAGACTTFSSWMTEIGVTVWTPMNGDEHDWGRQMIRGLLLMISGFHCLQSSLKIGKWVGQIIADLYQSRLDKKYVETERLHAWYVPKPAPISETEKTQTWCVPSPKYVREPVPLYTAQKAVFYWGVVAIVWSIVLILTILAAGSGDSGSETTGEFGAVLGAGCIFAPFGAWIRYQLSKYNPRCPTFPALTFAANIFATLVSVSMWIVNREFTIDVNPFQPLLARPDVWASAISGGLCGCLSTASTFANELDKLARTKDNKPNKDALVYGAASLFGAQALLCIVINAYLA